MYQGTVKGSDPGQTAAQKPGATPVASDMSAGHAPLHERLHRLGEVVRMQERCVPKRDVVELGVHFAPASLAHHLLGALHGEW